MHQITARALRQAEWKPIYKYDGYVSFVTYACDRLPGLTITKERRGKTRVKINTTYQFRGQKTNSPTQIVRYWNEHVKASKASKRKPGEPSGRPVADRVKPS